MGCFPNELVQLGHDGRLLVDQQSRIADDVYEQNVGDLQFVFGLKIISHRGAARLLTACRQSFQISIATRLEETCNNLPSVPAGRGQVPFMSTRPFRGYLPHCLVPLSPNVLPLRGLDLPLLFLAFFFFAINDLPPFVIDESAQSGGYSASN